MAVPGNRKRSANVGHHLDGRLVTYDDGTKGFRQNMQIPHPFLGAVDMVADAWGVPKMSVPASVYHGMFTFDVPSSMWIKYHSATSALAAETQATTNIFSRNGAGVVKADVTNPAVTLESRECPRYQPNRGHLFSNAQWCPGKTADGTRDWGLGTNENRIHFRLKSDGLLYAVRYSGGVLKQETQIPVENLPDGFDVEKGNVYDIQYQWRGLGSYFFYVNLKLVYTMNLLGTLTELSMENPALPIMYRAVRNTEDVEMNVGCSDISSENGTFNNAEQYESTYAEAVSVNGTNVPVLIINNPYQINSQTNTRTITLARISVTCSKKAVFKVWSTRDPSTITGATFGTGGFGSFVETDSPDVVSGAVRATAVTTTNYRPIVAIPVEAAVSRVLDNPYRQRIEFPLVRGDFLIVTCTATTATCDAVIEWGEQI